MSEPKLTEARFLAKTLRAPSGCLIWMDSVSTYGYGRLWDGDEKRHVGAHRVSHMLFIGPIPEGFQVDHLCRRTRCVEPMHLQAVPPRVNTLRSMGITALAAVRERCPQGHEYAAENTYMHRGKRHCRACRKARDKERGKTRVVTLEQRQRKAELQRQRLAARKAAKAL